MDTTDTKDHTDVESTKAKNKEKDSTENTTSQKEWPYQTLTIDQWKEKSQKAKKNEKGKGKSISGTKNRKHEK